MGFFDTITQVIQAPAKWTAQGIASLTGGEDDLDKYIRRLEANESNNSWGGALNAIADPTSTTGAFAAGTGKIMPSWMKEGAFPALVDMIAAYLYGYPGVMATSGLASQFKDENPDEAWTKAAVKGAAAYAGGKLTGAEGAAYGGTSVGTGDFDPVTGQEIMAPANTAYGVDSTDIAQGTAQTVAKNYVKNYALNALTSDQTAGGGGWQTRPQGFLIDETPLADEFAKNEDILDGIFSKTGEIGDYGTALSAVKAYETTAVARTQLEKEIFKYSGDPDYQAIEPELRVAAEEALQKGMTAEKAVEYAFEKAKKERAFREFLTDFKMKKKLELASWKDKTGVSKNRGYEGQEKMYPNQMEGLNSHVREFTPQFDNNPNDPMLYDPTEIEKYRERFRKQGVSL